jgi:release factor glutamine methyltransferase
MTAREVAVETSTQTEEQAWRIGGLLDWTARHLAKKEVEFPRLDAEVLLAHALGWRRIDLYTRYDENAPAEARARFRDLVRRRIQGCPVAYLVGRKEFFSLSFEVNPAVLIPRAESEFVVLECLRLAKTIAEPRVLDIGTGSGNLAIAIAHQHVGARAIAVDKSADALAVAGRNASRHGVAHRVSFVEGDLYSAVSGGERFDFIVSNPPYIPTADIQSLAAGVRDYEPHGALDGGEDGFAVFERLIMGARNYLIPGGYLIVEIGAPQESPARERIARYPAYQLADTIYDGSHHPRVLQARFGP